MKTTHERTLETIQDAIQKAKTFGFTVYAPENPEYFHFSDGENIGYCQTREIFHDSVQFSTVHKPNNQCGMGFGLQDIDNAIYPKDLTKDDFLNAFILTPSWWKKSFTPSKFTLKEWLETWSGKRSQTI